MKQDRGFGIIEIVVAIVVLGLIGGGAYLWYTQDRATSEGNPTPTVTPTPTTSPSSSPTPTPDPTADWKTYVSSDDRYTLKYPSDWAVRELSAEQTNFSGNGATFSIKRGALELGVYDPATTHDANLTVDGITVPAKEFDLASGGSGSEYLIAFEVDRNGNKYSFRLGGERGVNREQAKQVQLQILSTLDFID